MYFSQTLSTYDLKVIVIPYSAVSKSFCSLIGLNASLIGLAALYALYRFKIKTKEKSSMYSASLNLFQAALPYMSIIIISLAFQLLNIGRTISISFKFPGFITSLGYMVAYENAYATIRLFGHPAPVLLIASGIGVYIFKKCGIWDINIFKESVKKTISRCVPTSISLLCLISMALVMMDSGMTNQLAEGAASLSGRFYPLFAPFFGVLGSFITGSNTNSNVLFGRFQYTIAQSLGVSAAIMCGVQSMSGSIGVATGPATVLMGASASQLTGQESLIYRKVFGITLLIVFIFGIVNYILLEIMMLNIGGM